MTDVKIKVDASGPIRRLREIEERAHDFVPVFERAEAAIRAAMVANFASQGSLAGGWKPLSPRYGTWKAAHYFGLPLLVRTGKLASAVARGPDTEITAHHMMVRVPGTPDYLKFHQSGTYSMPARKVIITPPGFAHFLREAVGAHLMGRDAASLSSFLR